MTTDFGTLGVPYPLVEALAEQGKTSAFPIQVDTLPDTLTGRDVLGRRGRRAGTWTADVPFPAGFCRCAHLGPRSTLVLI